MNDKPKTFACYETQGISTQNLRALVRLPIPPGLSDEELRKVEEMVGRFNQEASIEPQD